MKVENKTKLSIAISVLVSLMIAFAFGRWSAPEKVRIETKTVEIEKKTEQKIVAVDKERHKKVTVVEVTKPNGEKTKTTEIIDDSNSQKKSDTVKNEQDTKVADKTEERISSSSKVTISALGGIDVGTGKTVIGASLTKPVLGPLTLGLWGMSDKTFGASVGLSF